MAEKAARVRRDALLQGARRRVHLQHAHDASARWRRSSRPAFGIDMDPSHIYRAGEDPAKALPAVLSRVRHIHIRDCKGRGPGPGEPCDQACGRGDIDLRGYFQAMVDGPVRRAGLPGGHRRGQVRTGAPRHHRRRELRLHERLPQSAGREVAGHGNGSPRHPGLRPRPRGHLLRDDGASSRSSERRSSPAGTTTPGARRKDARVIRLRGRRRRRSCSPGADVDAVVIGAETSLHAELVEQAARRARRSCCRSRMALTLAEADRIVAAVDRSSVPFTLAWQMRVDPHNVQVKRLLARAGSARSTWCAGGTA